MRIIAVTKIVPLSVKRSLVISLTLQVDRYKNRQFDETSLERIHCT